MEHDIKKILFATDLSKECRNSYGYAINLAIACQGGITLLHIIETPPISTEMQVKNMLGEERYEQILREHEKDTRSILIGKRKESEIIHSTLSGYWQDSMSSRPGCFLRPDEIIVKKGDVVTGILSTAKELESDLIVLSAHKNRRSDKSVSKVILEVLRLSPVPVIIVPPAKE